MQIFLTKINKTLRSNTADSSLSQMTYEITTARLFSVYSSKDCNRVVIESVLFDTYICSLSLTLLLQIFRNTCRLILFPTRLQLQYSPITREACRHTSEAQDTSASVFHEGKQTFGNSGCKSCPRLAKLTTSDSSKCTGSKCNVRCSERPNKLMQQL